MSEREGERERLTHRQTDRQIDREREWEGWRERGRDTRNTFIDHIG